MQKSDLLLRAQQEIKYLREKNTVMGARLQMFDDIKLMLFAQVPGDTMGMASNDIVRDLEKAIIDEQKAETAATGNTVS